LKEALKASFQIFELPLTPSCRKGAIKNKITPTLLFQIFFVRQVLRNKKKNHAEHENNRGDREQYAHSILLIT